MPASATEFGFVPDSLPDVGFVPEETPPAGGHNLGFVADAPDAPPVTVPPVAPVAPVAAVNDPSAQVIANYKLSRDEVVKANPGLDDAGILSKRAEYQDAYDALPASEKSRLLDAPVVTIPRMKGDGVGAGIERGAANLGEGLLRPSNIMLMAALGGAPAVLQKIAAGGFAVDMATHVPGQVQQAIAAPTPGGKAEAATEAVGTALLAVLAGKHAAGRPATGGASPELRSAGLPETAKAIEDLGKQAVESGEATPAPETPAPAAEAAPSPVDKLDTVLRQWRAATDPADKARLWDEARALGEEKPPASAPAEATPSPDEVAVGFVPEPPPAAPVAEAASEPSSAPESARFKGHDGPQQVGNEEYQRAIRVDGGEPIVGNSHTGLHEAVLEEAAANGKPIPKVERGFVDKDGKFLTTMDIANRRLANDRAAADDLAAKEKAQVRTRKLTASEIDDALKFAPSQADFDSAGKAPSSITFEREGGVKVGVQNTQEALRALREKTPEPTAPVVEGPLQSPEEMVRDSVAKNGSLENASEALQKLHDAEGASPELRSRIVRAQRIIGGHLEGEFRREQMAEHAKTADTEKDELYSVVKQLGGLPARNSKHFADASGEIESVMEAFKTKSTGNYSNNEKLGPYSTLFRSDALSLDDLRRQVNQYGFDFETGYDLLDAMQRRISTGEPHFGEKALPQGPGKMTIGELPPQRTTGLRKAVVADERIQRGLEDLPPAERQPEEARVQAAEDRADADPSLGASIVKRIVDDGQHAISPDDAAVLLVERTRLMNERTATEERLTNWEDVDENTDKLGEIEKSLNRLDQAQRLAGSSWGRVGHLYQRMMRADFTLEAMESRARAAKGGELTRDETQKIAEQAKEIARLQVEADGKAEALRQAAEASEVARVHEATIKQLQQQAAEGHPGFGKQVFEIAQGIVERWEKDAAEARQYFRNEASKLNMAATIIPPGHILALAKIIRAKIGRFGLDQTQATAALIAEFGEDIRPYITRAWIKAQQLIGKEVKDAKVRRVVKGGIKAKGEKTPVDVKARAKAEATAGEPLSHRVVYEMARAKINEGVHGEDAVMAAVHADLKEFFPALTERDVRRAFAEYGKVKFPNPAADAAELRELRTLVRLQESIDRETDGLDSLHSGLQRDKASQAIRDKQRALNELLKKRTGPPSPEKLASRDTARQTALRNQIEDLDRQLRTGEAPSARGPGLPDSPEVERMKAERDAMKEKLAEIEAEKNPPPTPAEKQVESLSKIRGRLDELLSGARDAKGRPDFQALSSAAEDMQAEILAMRELAAQLKRDAKPPVDVEGKRQEAQIKALEASIERYRAKTEANDFSSPGPRLGPDTARVTALKEVLASRKSMYETAKKAGRPVLTPEQRYNATRLKNLQRQIADVEARVKAGNYTKTPKPIPPAKTADVTAAEFRLSKAKEAFNRGVFEQQLANRGKIKKAFDFLRESVNFFRAMRTSIDLSAVLRQGGFIALGHPVRALKAFPAMFKALGSEAGEFAVNREIQSRPNAPLYRSAKLYLHDAENPSLSKMEEAYMSRWAKRIPGVSHSERAYTTFLNRLRADSFDAMVDNISSKALTGKATPEEASAIANFVNVATGRGNLGAVTNAAVNLNTFFFAPRYVMSRFELLAGQPLYKGTAATRIAIAKEYARYLAGVGAFYALASASGGKVEPDPRSADFGKVKMGATRLDPLSGLSQTSVLISRLGSGQMKGPGGIKDIRGPHIGFGQPTAADVAGRFMRSKLAPVPAALLNLSSGTNMVGQPSTLKSEALDLVTPLSFGDIHDAMIDQGTPEAEVMALLSIFGMGVQRYGPSIGK